MKIKKLLMIDWQKGYVQKGYIHDYLPTARETVKELGSTSGKFETLATEDCSVIDAENLRGFSSLLFTTSGDLPINEEQKKALLRFVREGGGFMGIHNATLTLRGFPDFGEMLGGYFNGHPWSQEVAVTVEDQSHPATRHLPTTFRVKEEIYQHNPWMGRENTHVLISVDNTSVDLSKGNRPDNDYALCWCHTFGKGRVFYTAFGHFPEIWKEEWFRKHLLNGILWTMRLVD